MDTTSILNDATIDELAEVNDRVTRLLAKWGALPWYSLQYRLGEVSNKRVDQRLLRRCLAELANNARPRRGALRKPGPTEVGSGIYSDPNLSPLEAESRAAQVSERLHLLTEATVRSLDPMLCLPPHLEPTDVTSESTARFVGGATFEAVDAISSISAENSRIRLWFSHDLEWIYPDDQRLWRLVAQCARDGHRPLIVARKLAPPTFVLLKALGIDGAQYYSSLIQPERIDGVRTDIEDMAWVHSRSTASLLTHAVRERVRHLVLREDPTWDIVAANLLRADPSIITASEELPPHRLLRWLEAADLRLPARWQSTVARWELFQAYRSTNKRRVKGAAPRGVKPPQSSKPLLKPVEQPASVKTAPENPASTSAHGFGRKTEKTRVPLRLR